MSALTPVPTYTFQECVNPDAIHTATADAIHTATGPTKQNMSNTHNICTHLQADLRGNSDNDNDEEVTATLTVVVAVAVAVATQHQRTEPAC